MKIAIDGPAGSGKSTVAKLVAKKLGFKHIDTGAYYRWVTTNALRQNIALTDNIQIIALAEKLDFIHIDESLIRSNDVSKAVSTIAAIPEVRKVVVREQRKAAEQYSIVMEGRDIGSVVFPDAEVKIFLNASVEERAKRRFLELKNKGEHVDLAALTKDIADRDHKDATRHASPMIKTADAIEIDTTGLSINDVVQRIILSATHK